MVPASAASRRSRSGRRRYGFADPLFARAQHTGAVRGDVSADDVMRLIFAVTAGVYTDQAQLERAVQIVLDGIRPRNADA